MENHNCWKVHQLQVCEITRGRIYDDPLFVDIGDLLPTKRGMSLTSFIDMLYLLDGGYPNRAFRVHS